MNIGPYCHFAQRDGVRAVFRQAQTPQHVQDLVPRENYPCVPSGFGWIDQKWLPSCLISIMCAEGCAPLQWRDQQMARSGHDAGQP